MSRDPMSRGLSGATVGLRCDASRDTGVGHAVRLLALAQELISRGVTLAGFGGLEIDWVARAYADLGVHFSPAADLSAAPITHAVLDGYGLSPSIGASLAQRGVRTLAMVDGPFGAEQIADVYVDQNFAAESAAVKLPAVAVAGISYALFRDEVLRARRPHVADSNPPRVLAVFGGTDPYAACPQLAALALATGLPMTLVAVAATTSIADGLATLATLPSQQVEIVRSPANLADLAAGCDAAISAAGSTIWELLCLGVPTASVCVVDNQEPGYDATINAGVTLAGGRLPRLRGTDREVEERTVVGNLTELIGDIALRDELRSTGLQLVDGRGRSRVADLLLQSATP
ncbi:hypothetical protein [Calidifontibacter terrae]